MFEEENVTTSSWSNGSAEISVLILVNQPDVVLVLHTEAKLLEKRRLEVHGRLPRELPRPRPLGHSTGGRRRGRPLERHLGLRGPELGKLGVRPRGFELVFNKLGCYRY